MSPSPLPTLLTALISLPLLYLLSNLTPSSNPYSHPLQSPFPSNLPILASHKIVAVGDLHGSLAVTKRVLRMAGVIGGEEDGWLLGGGTLVQTGDIVDRGTDTIALYRYFEELRNDAEKQGGRFVSLLGNHEYMNAMGDWRYVTDKDIDTFGGVDKRREALTPDGWLGKTWLTNYSLTARVPLHDPRQVSIQADPRPKPPLSEFSHAAISFLHAGLPPSTPSSMLLPYPSKLNNLAHNLLLKALLSASPPHPPNAFPGVPSTCTKQERDLWGGEGVLWYRGWALDEDEERVCRQAKEVMEKVGVRRMVMGHTPNFEGIQTRCNATILLIDTGISPAYGGPLSAISITTTLHPLDPISIPHELRKRRDGPERWLEREVVVSMSVDREDKEEKGERGKETVLGFEERVLGG